MKILVTGGAGFIGSHLVDALLERGDEVVIYDSLDPQIHRAGVPQYLSHDARLVEGDVRDEELLRGTIQEHNVEAIFHLAAAVGVGQSMYKIRHYADVNCVGTATLLDILANSSHDVGRLVVASSMSIYGEGAYSCPNHGSITPRARPDLQMEHRKWEVQCYLCGSDLSPLPTMESKSLQPTSIYATTKRDQEEMVLEFGQAYQIPSVALRYFNVYGSRQSLSNPYTGVLAIFASQLLNGKRPVIFEDGMQSRDFVHVSDIVRANIAALTSPNADYRSINIGTGLPTSVLEIASVLARELGKDLVPEVLGRFRAGDIRHCYADISTARELLDFEPQTSINEGIASLVSWMRSEYSDDMTGRALVELESRGLAR